jgi:hypothetical protein
MNTLKLLRTLALLCVVSAGLAFAAETKEAKVAACCAKAAAEHKSCEHACCIAAAKEGKNCTQCGGSGALAKPAEAKK